MYTRKPAPRICHAMSGDGFTCKLFRNRVPGMAVYISCLNFNRSMVLKQPMLPHGLVLNSASLATIGEIKLACYERTGLDKNIETDVFNDVKEKKQVVCDLELFVEKYQYEY